jgi:ribosomal protein S18 acetylase RimI-like enzyme
MVTLKPMDFVLTRATAADMPEVARVFRASREHSLPYLPDLHSPQEDLAFFTDVVFPNNIVIVARASDSHASADLTNASQIAGFIAFDKSFVHHLYLRPQYLRHGLGTRLLNEAMSKRDRLKLFAFQRNVNARAFYEKHGFTAVTFSDGAETEEKEPDVLYEWHRANEPTA